MKLSCIFRVEDLEQTCPVPLALDAGFKTWHKPFEIDGLSNDSTIEISICITTPHKYTVELKRIQLPIKILSFKPIEECKKTRSSVYAHKQIKSPRPEALNCIKVDDVNITYLANNFDQLIRLKIATINTEITQQMLDEYLLRTKFRITCKLNDLDFYKANEVELLQNNTKIYTWTFTDDNDAPKTNQIVNSPIECYDCDQDTSKENNTTILRCPMEDIYGQLIFVKQVFFPFTSKGYAPQTLKHTVTEQDMYPQSFDGDYVCGLAKGIVLKILSNEITLIVADHVETINREFSS